MSRDIPQSEVQFSRMALILGQEAVHTLHQKHIAVFGLGGVGAACAEALARAGVGQLTLVDHDIVQESNINRQLIALHSTIGLKKTEACAQRLKDIYPAIDLHCHDLFFEEATLQDIPLSDCDLIIDAIDTVSSKLLLAKQSHSLQIPLISCMGTGNKKDPTQFMFSDIYQTSVCPLCRVMRSLCKKQGIPSLKVLYSKEEPMRPIADEHEKRLPPGSLSFVPPVAGMMIAGEAIKTLILPPAHTP